MKKHKSAQDTIDLRGAVEKLLGRKVQAARGPKLPRGWLRREVAETIAFTEPIEQIDSLKTYLRYALLDLEDYQKLLRERCARSAVSLDELGQPARLNPRGKDCEVIRRIAERVAEAGLKAAAIRYQIIRLKGYLR